MRPVAPAYPHSVIPMTYTSKAYRANADGTMKLTLQKNATGPDGEPIEAGDTVVYKIVKHEKADD